MGIRRAKVDSLGMSRASGELRPNKLERLGRNEKPLLKAKARGRGRESTSARLPSSLSVLAIGPWTRGCPRRLVWGRRTASPPWRAARPRLLRSGKAIFGGRSHSSYRTRNSIQAPRCAARRRRRDARTMTCHARSNSKEATARSSSRSGPMTLSKRNRKSRSLARTALRLHEASKAPRLRRMHLEVVGRMPPSLRKQRMLR